MGGEVGGKGWGERRHTPVGMSVLVTRDGHRWQAQTHSIRTYRHVLAAFSQFWRYAFES